MSVGLLRALRPGRERQEHRHRSRPSGTHGAGQSAWTDERAFDPNSNRRATAYAFNEFKFSETLKAQIAGRIETLNLRGTVPDILAGDLNPIARNLAFTPKSASFGVIQDVPWDFVGSLTSQYVERAPKPRRAILVRFA